VCTHLVRERLHLFVLTKSTIDVIPVAAMMMLLLLLVVMMIELSSTFSANRTSA
jgi:hypothetical protein